MQCGFGLIRNCWCSNQGGAVYGWEMEVSHFDACVFLGNSAASGGAVSQGDATGVGDTPSAAALVSTTNYPNPFSSETTIDVSLANEADVDIEVFDVVVFEPGLLAPVPGVSSVSLVCSIPNIRSAPTANVP